MQVNYKRLITLLVLSMEVVIANDSFYTKTKNEKSIDEEENFVIVQLDSPKEHNVTIADSGSIMMQLSIDGYPLTTAQIPDLIEWRTKDKKIIGAIVRTYEPFYDENKEMIIDGKYSSILNVLLLDKEITLLGKSESNSKARELLDGIR